MAYSYHANQYEGAYNHTRMTSWTVPKPREQTSKKPKFREGSSFFIANDRGYLAPDVPRSKENPWGTFLGTWDLPQHIPQPRPNLTARKPANAAQLIKQVKASPLCRASNGFGLQPMFLHCMEPALEDQCSQTQGSPNSPLQFRTRSGDQEATAGSDGPFQRTGRPGRPGPGGTATSLPHIRPSPPGTQGTGRGLSSGMRGHGLDCQEYPRSREQPGREPELIASAARCGSPLIG
ncbi:protein Flattop [Amblyraja radiata]|uniref:protein Flattop n=1 Tax=Amblyraja radiata TaxID=386614 RepID=UPI0014041777|nr:protein Flattop [Amblyraja radiata]